MKKVGIIAYALFFTAIIVIVDNFTIRLVAIMLTLILFQVAISMKRYARYIKNKFPGTVSSTIRNYELIVIGNRVGPSADGELNLTGYNRNLYTDYLILQRYYGFLKKNGKVRLEIDPQRGNYFFGKKINVLDYPALHEVTLWEHGIDVRSWTYPIFRQLVAACFDLICLLIRVKQSGPVHMGELEDISSFCRKKELSLEIVVYADREKYKDIFEEKPYERAVVFHNTNLTGREK